VSDTGRHSHRLRNNRFSGSVEPNGETEKRPVTNGIRLGEDK